MIKSYILLICLGFFYSVDSFALQVDEKLTLRVLRTSSTKKTILISAG